MTGYKSVRLAGARILHDFLDHAIPLLHRQEGFGQLVKSLDRARHKRSFRDILRMKKRVLEFLCDGERNSVSRVGKFKRNRG
jgi:hypothetical protein